jgi:hypothetical protein
MIRPQVEGQVSVEFFSVTVSDVSRLAQKAVDFVRTPGCQAGIIRVDRTVWQAGPIRAA